MLQMGNRETLRNGGSRVVVLAVTVVICYVAVVVVLLRFGRFDKVRHTGSQSTVVGIIWNETEQLAQEST